MTMVNPRHVLAQVVLWHVWIYLVENWPPYAGRPEATALVSERRKAISDEAFEQYGCEIAYAGEQLARELTSWKDYTVIA